MLRSMTDVVGEIFTGEFTEKSELTTHFLLLSCLPLLAMEIGVGSRHSASPLSSSSTVIS